MIECVLRLRFTEPDDATVVAAIEDGADPRAWWACDGWDSGSAEVAAAMNISSRRASGQMRIAEALRDHLPLVAALYWRGELSTRVVVDDHLAHTAHDR